MITRIYLECGVDCGLTLCSTHYYFDGYSAAEGGGGDDDDFVRGCGDEYGDGGVGDDARYHGY